ncbi:ComF family protein [Ruminococcus sp.]|uniref:ComF family protein n=1 Tax=Ruminococcus sp. TaxID=41978 RepID=UPI002675FD9C|nr:phosphoribosyltransferase family protein [uncultured Ruminococcus sp.]
MKAIHQLKDDRQLNFAEYSAKLLGNVLRENGIVQQADIITSVPMHRSKRRKRGYDQAQKLAHFTAMELGIREDHRLLGRTRDTAEQHTLTASERKTHAEEIYFSLPDHADIKGKNILLFDDVYTTGATLNVCSRLLKEMGAKKVFCAAIATTLLDEKHKE